MPFIPNIGSDGTALGRAHANGRDNGFTPAQALPFLAQEDVFPDNFSILLIRAQLGSINATVAMAEHKREIIRAVATSVTTLSLGSALLAVYWFCMMRRNFRRDLVLLLILGGSWKSLWFLIFSGATFADGPVRTESAFCQASGYFLLVGFESCDIAILLMSMHMCLQIFPSRILGHDGLYSVRKWVYAVWLILPNVIASLAFINPRGGYVAQGAFCFLPVRPFWYRLALFWIPRYLIWIYITYVAVRIYRHVGAEFKVFGQERDRSSSLGMVGESSIDRAKQRDEMKRRASQANNLCEKNDGEGCAPDDVSGQLPLPQQSTKSFGSLGRNDSPPEWSHIGFAGEQMTPTQASRSMPTYRRGSKMLAPGVLSEDFAPPAAFDGSRHRGSITSLGSKRSGGHASFAEDAGLPPINEGLAPHSAAVRSEQNENTANRTMELRRRAIQRQLRLLFIYPCVYMILWIIPFAVHCMNYSDYWARHPIIALNIVQILCMGIMTFVDVIIFSWREKPWRHIPGSNGTFWGSLCWWQYAFDGAWARARRESRAPSFPEEAGEKELHSTREKSISQTGLLASIKRWSLSLKGQSPRGSQSDRIMAPPPSAATNRPSVPQHKRNFSGGSDRKHMEAERAHQRLAMERAEYEQNRKSLNERRASVISAAKSQQERKDWFDRDLDDDLFRDGSMEEEGKRGTV